MAIGNPPRRRGLTLLELLLALSMTAVIGLCVASVLMAASQATASRNDQRNLVVKQKVLEGRLAGALRGARAVLAVGTDYLVLWRGDTRANAAPDLSELRRIERDASGRLWAYQAKFPAGWTQAQIDAADTQYQLGDDFGAVTAALKQGTLFPGEIWATGVTSLALTLDSSDPQSARLVSYRAALLAGTESPQGQVLVGAAALRNSTLAGAQSEADSGDNTSEGGNGNGNGNNGNGNNGNGNNGNGNNGNGNNGNGNNGNGNNGNGNNGNGNGKNPPPASPFF